MFCCRNDFGVTDDFALSCPVDILYQFLSGIQSATVLPRIRTTQVQIHVLSSIAVGLTHTVVSLMFGLGRDEHAPQQSVDSVYHEKNDNSEVDVKISGLY